MISLKEMYAPPGLVYFSCMSYLVFQLACNLAYTYKTISMITLVCPVSWTFQEFVFHRFLLHRHPAVKKSHAGHHKYPKDTRRLFIPMIFTFGNGILNYLVFYAIGGRSLANANHIGNTLCYFSFEASHYICHMCKTRKLTRGIQRHHLSHHHLDKVERNFGFTCAAWDILFGTYYPEGQTYSRLAILGVPYPILPLVLDGLIY